MAHIHYFPLSLGLAGLFFVMLVGLAILTAIGLLSRVSAALGIHPLAVTMILFASLLGSYVNVPIARLPGERVDCRARWWSSWAFRSWRRLRWTGPERCWRSTSAAPSFRYCSPSISSSAMTFGCSDWSPSAIVAFFVHQMAVPVPGVGISVPTFVPPLLAAFAGLVAVAPIRCASRLHRRQHRRAGRGRPSQPRRAEKPRRRRSLRSAAPERFDGVFLTGVIAVVLASLVIG